MGVLFGVSYTMICLTIGTNLNFLDIELSRKIAHMTISFWWFIAAWMSPADRTLFWAPAIVLVLFTLINRTIGFKGIMRADGKKEYGAQCFFIAMIIFLAGAAYFNKPVSYVGLFFMPLGYGDAMAAIIGKRYGRKSYTIMGGKKTYLGNISMFCFSLVALIIYTYVFKCNYGLQELIIISILATIFEAVGTHGFDNLLMTCGTWVICYFCFGIGQ